MVSACLDAHPRDRRSALGRARARAPSTGSSARTSCTQPLYDPLTGGCRDGLHADRVNENQGAESTLSFLLALMEMRADEVRWNAMQVPIAEPAEVLMAMSAGPVQ